jgi:hypothetical protein
MLFREIIAVCYENHRKPINTFCGQNVELFIIKAGGTYRYHLHLTHDLYPSRNNCNNFTAVCSKHKWLYVSKTQFHAFILTLTPCSQSRPSRKTQVTQGLIRSTDYLFSFLSFCNDIFWREEGKGTEGIMKLGEEWRQVGHIKETRKEYVRKQGKKMKV